MNHSFIIGMIYWISLHNCFFHAAGYINGETALMRDLLSADHYEPRSRPVRNSSTSVYVECTYVLEVIIDIDEENQNFEAYGWISMKWKDEFLQWTPSDYANVSILVLPSTAIWMPDIINRNSADQVYGDILDNTMFNAEVTNTGSVGSFRAGKTLTSCLLDVTYFPFDSQTCYIELDSWSFDTSRLSLKVVENIDVSRYCKNSEWDLIGTNISNGSLAGYPDYDVVHFTFYMKRKPTYFVLMIIIPCVIQSLMTVLVFLVPPESGEKISLQITILLSFSVFQLTIADSIPKTSDYTPIISIYVNISIIIASLSLFLSVLTLRMHHAPRDIKPLPNWLQILSRFLGSYEPDYTARNTAPNEKSKRELFSLPVKLKRNQVGSNIIDVKPASVASVYHMENKQHNQFEPIDGSYTSNPICRESRNNKDPLTEAQREYQKLARKCDQMFLKIFSVLAIFLLLGCFLTILVLSRNTHQKPVNH